jgi:hypothetical protein
MITEEKIREVKKLLRRGEPEGEIREKLKQEGFTKEDLNTIFTPHHYDMRSWYLFFGILVSLAGLYLLLKTGGFLILILGALLFVAYYYEIKRLENMKRPK